MKIQSLFESYEKIITATPGSETIFSNSGMLNNYKKLDFGFFPLGSGVFTCKSKVEEADIEECEIMVLGNDFGTDTYVTDKCKNNRESNSRTITNLKKLGLDCEKTFFTNLYMGLRDDTKHPGTTMTKRKVKIQEDYRDLCFLFFQKQLELINPKTVLCLGKDVGQSLSERSNIFFNFSSKEITISKLFTDTNQTDYIVNSDDGIFSHRRFVLIPHPSFAHINWSKNDIEQKIKRALKV